MKTHVAYTFGGFLVDPAKRELWRGDKLVPLQPKAFDCLCYLLQNRDRVVGHDEIISAVWGLVDLNDHALMHSISRARQALGDTGEKQRMIRTVNRVGYGWIMPVEEIEVDANDNGNGNGGGEYGNNRAPGRPFPIGSRSVYALALLLPLLALAAWAFLFHGNASPEPFIEGEIALVLPVTVEGEENEAWIRLGVMDFIAERLREAGQAVVPSDNTVALVQQFNGHPGPGSDEIAQLARSAAARMVFQPRAERIDDQWRVTLQAVHGSKRQLVANGEGADVIAAARAAADRATLMLGYPMIDDTASDEPGLDLLLQRVKAAQLSDRFDEAITLLDSVNPQLQSHPRIRYQRATVDFLAGRRLEAEAAYRALLRDISPDQDPLMHARAQAGLGNALLRQGDMDGAEAAYTRVLQLVEASSGYEARHLLGQAYLGRVMVKIVQENYRAAQADLARARTAFRGTGDQLYLAKIDGNLAVLLTIQKRYAEALPHSRRALQRVRAFGDLQSEVRIRGVLARTYLQLLDAPTALAEMQQLDDLLAQIDNSRLASTINLYRVEILFENGALDAAYELLEQELEQESPRGAEVAAAAQALALGDPEAAVRFAKTALQRTWEQPVVATKARVWLTLFQAYRQTGQTELAAETADAALAWADTEDHSMVELWMTLLRAEYAALLGDSAGARNRFEAALELAATQAGPIELLQATEPYVEWLIARGDLDHASVVAGGVAGWDTTSYSAALLQLRTYHALGDTTAWRQALNRTQSLAGERRLPPELLDPPVQFASAPPRL